MVSFADGSESFTAFMKAGTLLPQSRTLQILWSSSSVILSVALLLVITTWAFSKKIHKNLPPGPPAWPFIGSLFELEPRDRINKAFANLAKKYGPIVHLKLGTWHAIVISSTQLTEELFKVKDLEFASRPNQTTMRIFTKYVGFEGRNIMFQSYNANVKNLRKLCTMELLSGSNMKHYSKLRSAEINMMLKNMVRDADKSGSVTLKGHLVNMTTNTMSELLISKRVLGDEVPNGAVDADIQAFRHVLKGMEVILGSMDIAELIPALEWIDPAGLLPKYKALQTSMMRMFERFLNEHKQARITRKNENGFRDFCDVLLDYEEENKKSLPDIVVMGVLWDMLAGGSETTPIVVEWALSELLANPPTMRRVKEEIDSVVGHSRAVKESDLNNLPVLEAVIKETLRLHPPLPLLIPRLNSAPTTLGGYDIPKNSTLFVNACLLSRDPSIWENPLGFDPDRFLDNQKR